MNLIRHSQANSSLSTSDQRIIEASMATRIRFCDKRDLFSEVTQAIQAGFFNLGYKPKEKDELKITAAAVCRDLVSKFQGLTVEDVKIVIDMGSKGDFKTKPDDVIMITVSSIYQWLRKYVELRREAVAKIPEPEEVKQVDPEEIERQFVNDCILSDWYRSVEAGVCLVKDEYGAIFDYLTKKGILSASDDERRETYVLVSSSYKKSLRRSKIDKKDWFQLDEFLSSEFDRKSLKDRKRNIFYLEAVRNTKSEMTKRFVCDLLKQKKDLCEMIKDSPRLSLKTK